MFKKHYLLLVFFILTSSASMAQQSLDWNFSGLGFMDNREYKNFISRSHTFSGTRIALDFGLNLDSLNHFIVGANGLHEFGSKSYFLKVDPVAYYSFKSTKWLFNAGEFPREGLLDDYPRALLNDTLAYYRPNIEGLFARLQTGHGYESIWIDWISRQTDTQREQFLFGLSGKYALQPSSPFYISHYVFMLHDANPAIESPGDHIRDNGAGQLRLGLDLSRRQTLFDSLTVEAGAMISFERIRNVTDIQTPKGFVASVYLGHRRFSFYDEFYAGQGHHLIFGDAFYEEKMYNRLDISYTAFSYNRLRGKFTLSLHQSPGNWADNQEAFKISYSLGRKILTRFKSDE